MFFHYNSIRTYTGALLSLFNNIETRVLLSSGEYHYQPIPIEYSNQERSTILNGLSNDQIFNGNTQVLPRMILLFTGLTVNRQREHSKFIKFKFKNKTYQYNSIPADFGFSVIAQARGMTEASMIIEQVMTYFNPSYNMKIYELPIEGNDYTSVILTCESVSVDQQDASTDQYSTNIVTITFDLNIRGNLYPVIRDADLIEKIQIFLSAPDSEGNPKRVNSDYYNIKTDTKFHNFYYAKITGIKVGKNTLECIYDSPCEKLIKFKFTWFLNGVELPYHTLKINQAVKSGDLISVKMETDLVESNTFELKVP